MTLCLAEHSSLHRHTRLCVNPPPAPIFPPKKTHTHTHPNRAHNWVHVLKCWHLLCVQDKSQILRNTGIKTVYDMSLLKATKKKRETKCSALVWMVNFGVVHHDGKTHTIKITFLMFTCKHYNNHTHTHSVCDYSSWRWKLTEGKKMNQEPIFCQLPFKVAKYNPNFRLHPVTFKNRPRSRNFHKTIQTGPALLQHFCTWFDYTWSEHYDD